MAQPTQSAVHVNRPLTNISVAYMQGTDEYISDKVFPVIPVDKASDSYYVYTKNDWFRDEAQVRPPATESAGGGYGITTDNYNTKTWAFHKDVPWDIRANQDDGIDLDRDATEFVTQRLLLRRERDWASKYFGAGIWGTTITGVASAPSTNQVIQWSNYASSDPAGDLDIAKRYIKLTTGMNPNTLVLGYDVFTKLKRHTAIKDQYKYVNSDVITTAMLAKLFDIDRVLVAGGVYATNNEGEAAAYSFVQGKGALLAYAAPRPSPLLPSAGYTFQWKGISQGAGQTVAIQKFPIRELKVDRVEGEMAFDNKVVATDLGYFFDSIVA